MPSKYVYNEKYGTTHRSEDNENVNANAEILADYTDWISQPNQHMDIVERVIPTSVTPVQMRKALNLLGLRNSVEAAVTAMGLEARDTWEYSAEIQRTHPLVIIMGEQFGVDLDNLFITAATL